MSKSIENFVSEAMEIERSEVLSANLAREAPRGRGYAKAVCAKLIREMTQKGTKGVVLSKGHENTSAIRCYEGLGFEINGSFYVAKLRRWSLVSFQITSTRRVFKSSESPVFYCPQTSFQI